MSSIQNVPVEILLDVFKLNDPADTEALHLTCHRFHVTILQNVDTLPMRLVCDLAYDTARVMLYWNPTNDDSYGELIATGTPAPSEFKYMRKMFERNTAIRKVMVWAARDPTLSVGHLVEHFPAVKRAMSLEIDDASALPTDAELDHFECLETIDLRMRYDAEDTSAFWSEVFATKAFRRVPNFLLENLTLDEFPAVDAGEMFDFITDFSRMPAGKPRAVRCVPFKDYSLDELERRFDKNMDSIDGQVCAAIADRDFEFRYLTNMAVGSEKKALAKQLLRDAE